MNELQNWTEVTRGIYRYIISVKCCYEIHILYHLISTDILTAKASLFLVGNWHNRDSKTNYFERECLLSEQPLIECLAFAVKDNAENNN